MYRLSYRLFLDKLPHLRLLQAMGRLRTSLTVSEQSRQLKDQPRQNVIASRTRTPCVVTVLMLNSSIHIVVLVLRSLRVGWFIKAIA